jgi:hypothetical protein
MYKELGFTKTALDWYKMLKPLDYITGIPITTMAKKRSVSGTVQAINNSSYGEFAKHYTGSRGNALPIFAATTVADAAIPGKGPFTTGTVETIGNKLLKQRVSEVYSPKKGFKIDLNDPKTNIDWNVGPLNLDLKQLGFAGLEQLSPGSNPEMVIAQVKKKLEGLKDLPKHIR